MVSLLHFPHSRRSSRSVLSEHPHHQQRWPRRPKGTFSLGMELSRHRHLKYHQISLHLEGSGSQNGRGTTREGLDPALRRPCTAWPTVRFSTHDQCKHHTADISVGLDLQELKERAFQHIIKSLTVENVAYEVFSDFSATFEDVRKVCADGRLPCRSLHDDSVRFYRSR